MIRTETTSTRQFTPGARASRARLERNVDVFMVALQSLVPSILRGAN
jgi:hypothetical protein